MVSQLLKCHAECHYAERRYAECPGAYFATTSMTTKKNKSFKTMVPDLCLPQGVVRPREGPRLSQFSTVCHFVRRAEVLASRSQCYKAFLLL